MQKLRQPRTGADENCFKTIVKEFIYGNGLADNSVVNDLDSHLDQVLDLSRDNFLRKTELRNTVYQHTAGLVKRFKDGYVVAHFAQIARTGQTGRAGADHRNTVAV